MPNSIRGRLVLDDYGKPAQITETEDGFDARLVQGFPSRLFGFGVIAIMLLLCGSALLEPELVWIAACVAGVMGLGLLFLPRARWLSISAHGDHLQVRGYFGMLLPWQRTRLHVGSPPAARLTPGLEEGPPVRELCLEFAGVEPWHIRDVSIDRESSADFMDAMERWRRIASGEIECPAEG